jgi:hypothetical protein
VGHQPVLNMFTFFLQEKKIRSDASSLVKKTIKELESSPVKHSSDSSPCGSSPSRSPGLSHHSGVKTGRGLSEPGLLQPAGILK